LSATSVSMCRRNRSSAAVTVTPLMHPTHHSHAARSVACHGVRSHAVAVTLVGECSIAVE